MSRRVVTVDCHYTGPRVAAAYLIVDGDRAAFVDNNTSLAAPLLLAALAREGLSPAQVELAIVTHVHLDHAGGSSALMQACPQATLVAHPRAARHLVDPERLVASARRVYGGAAFERMYGRIEPIPAARVRTMEDGAELAFGHGPPLRFLHTRGHANHHFCVHEPETESLFAGDAFGIAYPDAHPFVFATTSPTDFDGAAAIEAVRRLRATSARIFYPTHFGAVRDPEGAAAGLLESLEFSTALSARAAASGVPDEALDAFCQGELRGWFQRAVERHRLSPDARMQALLESDVLINGQGLAHAARKARAG